MASQTTHLTLDQFVELQEEAVEVIELDSACTLLILGEGEVAHYNAVLGTVSRVRLI